MAKFYFDERNYNYAREILISAITDLEWLKNNIYDLDLIMERLISVLSYVPPSNPGGGGSGSGNPNTGGNYYKPDENKLKADIPTFINRIRTKHSALENDLIASLNHLN